MQEALLVTNFAVTKAACAYMAHSHKGWRGVQIKLRYREGGLPEVWMHEWMHAGVD